MADWRQKRKKGEEKKSEETNRREKKNEETNRREKKREETNRREKKREEKRRRIFPSLSRKEGMICKESRSDLRKDIACGLQVSSKLAEISIARNRGSIARSAWGELTSIFPPCGYVCQSWLPLVGRPQ